MEQTTPIPNFSELVLLMHHTRSIINKPFLTEIEHGLQSRPPSPKRAERKVSRRPFREAGSGQNNGTR